MTERFKVDLLRTQLAGSPRVELVVGKGRQHWYRVEGYVSKHKDGLWPSVTTILGATIPKPALVPWAKNLALEKMRQVMKSDGGAIWDTVGDYHSWVDDKIEAARRLPDQVRDEAGDFGTRAHQAISSWLKGGVEPEEGSELRPPFVAFQEWMRDSGFEVLATEVSVFNPVSEEQPGYAGTVDLLMREPGGMLAIA